MPYLGNEVAPLVQALEGKELKLDSDGDSSIQASTDDTVVFKTNSNTALSIDANGHITKPLQSAFFANVNTTQSNIPINTDNILVINNERFDQNSDFDTSTYTFTAPVTGKYQFNLTVYMTQLPTDADWIQAYIVTTNKLYYAIVDTEAFDASHTYYTLDTSVLVEMDANDTCFCKLRQANGTATLDYSNNTNFSGFLVC